MRWNAIATEGTEIRRVDWSKRLPTGSTLSSVTYTADPDSGLTFTNASVTSNISTVTITADKTEQDYWVKLVPTLDTGDISPVSIKIKIVKHKAAK